MGGYRLSAAAAVAGDAATALAVPPLTRYPKRYKFGQTQKKDTVNATAAATAATTVAAEKAAAAAAIATVRATATAAARSANRNTYQPRAYV